MADRRLLALRISLVFALTAIVAVMAVVFLEIRPRIQRLGKERDALNTSAEQNRARATKAEAFARELTARLADAEVQAATTLHDSIKDADRNTRLLIELEETRAALHKNRQELARWNAIGTSPDEIAALSRENKTLAAQLSQMQTKYDQLARDYANVKSVLDIYPDAVPELPIMQGSVLVVDPKWNFVVLDLGETNGLLKNGILMISRNDKLISKVKVRHIGPNRSIADILPGWSISEVREGDRVMN